MHSQKSDLRRLYTEKRKGITPAEHALWSGQCSEHIIQFIGTMVHQPSVIAGYMPIGTELNIVPALEVLLNSYLIALPVVTPDSRQLTFRRWKAGDKLVKGPFDIPEPSTDAGEEKPDLIIVPLLAYGAKGERLGYGKGYYDTTLHYSKPQIRTLGVAFSLQYCPEIPITPQDETLDGVVTEKGVNNFLVG